MEQFVLETRSMFIDQFSVEIVGGAVIDQY